MTIQRTPSPVFAALWGTWITAVFIALANPARPLMGLLVLLAFFAVEVPATVIKGGRNARDTLSEITTWLQRKTSHHRRLRGWNLVLLALIVAICWLFMRTVAHYSQSDILGLVLAASVGLFLWDHLVSPDVHG